MGSLPKHSFVRRQDGCHPLAWISHARDQVTQLCSPYESIPGRVRARCARRVHYAFMLGRVGLQWAGRNPQMSGGTKMRCVVLTTRLIHNQTLRSQSVGR